MSNLVGIVGPAHDLRHEYVSKVMQDLSPFSWLKEGQRDFGYTTLAWAAIPSAPISSCERADGFSALVIGSLGRDSDHKNEVSDAEHLLELYKAKGPTGISGQSGFFAACVFDPAGDTYVATDTLGLFPIYYHSTPNWLLFSTALSAFHHFPKFRAELSPQGLVGILLTMHIIKGQTIWKGVRRLSPGHILHWRSGTIASECRADPLKPTCEHFGSSLNEHIDLFDRALNATIRRETSGHPTYILLSGGLDSRILAGYLQRIDGTNIKAVTFGASTDHDMRCASIVAERLGWPHIRLSEDFSSFVESAWVHINFEHMSNGLTGLAWRSAISGLPDVGSRLVTGLLGDAVMAGSHILWGREEGQTYHSFDAIFKKINRFGLKPDVVRRLVHQEVLADSLEEVIEDMRNIYESIDGLPFQRSLLFDLLHRQRFYVATLAWRTSFRVWPVLPFFNRSILDLACGMPGATLLDRRAQINLLCSRYPNLARLPLDRGSNNTYPILVPSFRDRLRMLLERLAKHLKTTQIERRYNYRVGDINNPGWISVRREAEAYRRKAEVVFNPSVLREILPTPHSHIALQDMLMEAEKIKILVGILLLAGKYL